MCVPYWGGLEVQWTQKNDKKGPFLLRLSLRDGLQDLKQVSCVTEVVCGVICGSRNLTWESQEGGIREGNRKARQSEQLHRTHLFGDLVGQVI